MINTEKFMELLAEKLGVSEYIGVPCSNLKYLINNASNHNQYIPSPNEGEAVAYAAGSYLAGKKVAVMMQNSGFANALNVITSLTCIYQIPQLYLIGYRGMHGEGTDEPQHLVMGKVTEKWLVDCGITPLVVSKYQNEEELISHLEDIYSTLGNKSVALLFDKKDCSEVTLIDSEYQDTYPLSRTDVISQVNSFREDKTIVVATTGFTGRDLYDHFENPKNFYMVGSMGCAISLACGIAKNKPDYKIIVIDGDGAVMMRPQGGILAESLHLNNLLHIIIDNRKYESTGGQLSPKCNLLSLEDGIRTCPVTYVNNIEGLDSVLNNFYNNSHPCKVAVVKVNPNLNDNKLGRPKETSVELANRFMEAIK